MATLPGELDHVLLMAPGPSPFAENVLKAMSLPTLGHMDPQCIQLMDAIQDQLRAVCKTKNAVTFPISGIGSSGMETVFVNLIVLHHAVFAEKNQTGLTVIIIMFYSASCQDEFEGVRTLINNGETNMQRTEQHAKWRNIDQYVFLPATVLTLAMAILFTLDPVSSNNMLDKIHAFTTRELGWFFLLATFAAVVTCQWLSISRFGGIVLGGKSSQVSGNAPGCLSKTVRY